MTVEGKRIHVYPVQRKNRSTHITKKHASCWCAVEEVQICPESEGPIVQLDGDGNCPATCWRCAGRGLVPVYDEQLDVIFLHQEGQLTDA